MLNKSSQDVEFSNLPIRTQWFLAACRKFKPDIDLHQALQDCPHGGIIGIGDSKLDRLFRRSKVFRLHAILHDAAGYVRAKYGCGPGYLYMLDNCPINCCFLGHLSGLVYCLYLKLFSKLYSTLDC